VAAGPYLPAAWSYPLRTLGALAALVVFSRGVLRLRPARWAASAGVGLAVFAVWVGPDLLFPGYRQHWLFHNALTGTTASGLPAGARENLVAVLFRVSGSALVVPVVEELFWRAWLMRWLISPRLETVPLGAWSARAFWITALLFASEHGAYWDVGLAAGILYNLWMVRTRSLADCILAHAVTNACLAAWVLGAGQWQYWL
jgi:CAAX prenyl protease-like protein